MFFYVSKCYNNSRIKYWKHSFDYFANYIEQFRVSYSESILIILGINEPTLNFAWMPIVALLQPINISTEQTINNIKIYY